MKDKLHRLSNKIEEVIKGTTVLQTSGPRTTTLDLKGLLAKTSEVKVSLQLLSVTKKYSSFWGFVELNLTFL